MYYFIFHFLSPLIEVLSNHPPNFKLLVPQGDCSSHVLSPIYSCITFLSAEVSWCKCSVLGRIWHSLTVTFRNQLYVLFGVKYLIHFSHCRKKISLTCSQWKEGYSLDSDLSQHSGNIPGFWIWQCALAKNTLFNLHTCIKFSESFAV